MAAANLQQDVSETLADLELEDAYVGRRRPKQPVAHRAVMGRYVGYLMYFMGTALISGAVIHHPMDPSRYTKIAVAGVTIFIVATIYNDFVLTRIRPTLRMLAGAMFMALLLSFGVGMVTGGLQHFEDFPVRAAGMIPIGLVLSFIAFAIKDTPQAWHRLLLGWSGLTVAVLAAATFFGLGQLASIIEKGGGAGHGHSHGTSTAADTTQAPAAPQPQPGQEQPVVVVPDSAGDGHSDHGH